MENEDWYPPEEEWQRNMKHMREEIRAIGYLYDEMEPRVAQLELDTQVGQAQYDTWFATLDGTVKAMQQTVATLEFNMNAVRMQNK